jgi:putative glycosyltransferase (exosortase G-associated)
MDHLLAFTLFWGAWLLVPMLIDGLTTVASLAGVLIQRARRARLRKKPLAFAPLVSLIVPVFNSSQTLEACLRALAAQDYPTERMDILVANNGSTDDSFAVFARMQQTLGLQLSWHPIINQGKAWALNAGIHLARGKYIFNIDSDVVLAPDAIRRVVETLEAEPDLGAVTGAVEVLPPSADAGPLRRLLNECEFFEYLAAFHVGREQQTLLGNLYTLSGAFSVFRREVLLRTFLYNQETVTEDTDLTFELYERCAEWRVGCVSDAVAYVHPIESLGALYSQRVRWQRGQLEVSARHAALLRRPMWQLRGFAPARILAVDHTLAFPRLVWTFLLPVLALYGYSGGLILGALVILYGFYMLIDLLWLMVAWLDATAATRQRLGRVGWLLPLLPLYRMTIFWFRLSGFLQAVAEPGTWRVADPVMQVRQAWYAERGRLRQLWQRLRVRADPTREA